MSTIIVDRRGFEEICKNNNECINMKTNMHRLSQYIDNWYKRSSRLLDSMDANNPNHQNAINEIKTQLKTLELVSGQITKLFEVTVLTEPRE